MTVSMTVTNLPQQRCPRCNQLLFFGELAGTIKCHRCDLIVKFLKVR